MICILNLPYPEELLTVRTMRTIFKGFGVESYAILADKKPTHDWDFFNPVLIQTPQDMQTYGHYHPFGPKKNAFFRHCLDDPSFTRFFDFPKENVPQRSGCRLRTGEQMWFEDKNQNPHTVRRISCGGIAAILSVISPPAGMLAGTGMYVAGGFRRTYDQVLYHGQPQ